MAAPFGEAVSWAVSFITLIYLGPRDTMYETMYAKYVLCLLVITLKFKYHDQAT